MKMTKKLITLALAALMLLGLAVPAAAFLDENGFETTWYVSGEDFNITTVHLIEYVGPGGDIVIPFDVQVIEGGVFYNCTTLTSVTIPEYVSEIGWQAFWGCTNLTDVYFRGTREQWQAILSTHKETAEGPIFDEGAKVTVHCNSNGPYVPPTPVTPDMRKDSDFEYSYFEYEGIILDTYLKKYRGPGGDVVIPDGISSIANEAFYYCQNLTSVVIPSGVDGIYYEAFAYCTNLKSITIPASVVTLGADVFRGCINLTDVYFCGTREQWAALEQQLKDWDYGPMFPQDVNPTVHYNSAGPDTPTTPATPSFGDVPADAWYAAPVAWAVEKGITNGTSKDTFSPNKTCNNAEILTFLWRACGKPEAPEASFTDVASGVWYADAANWAKSKDMISGDKLSPETPCTRASAVMFIWQAMGKPAASKAASFTDVPANADYAAAVAWAVEKGVTNGTGADTFSPGTICTRAQIVTFLQRAYA